jgi:hypothetical protein
MLKKAITPWGGVVEISSDYTPETAGAAFHVWPQVSGVGGRTQNKRNYETNVHLTDPTPEDCYYEGYTPWQCARRLCFRAADVVDDLRDDGSGKGWGGVDAEGHKFNRP